MINYVLLLFDELHINHGENPLLVAIATTVPVIVHFLVNSHNVTL